MATVGFFRLLPGSSERVAPVSPATSAAPTSLPDRVVPSVFERASGRFDELMSVDLKHAGPPALLPDGRWIIVTTAPENGDKAGNEWYAAVVDPVSGDAMELDPPPIDTGSSPVVSTFENGDVVICGCGGPDGEIALLDAETLTWTVIAEMPVDSIPAGGNAALQAQTDGSVILFDSRFSSFDPTGLTGTDSMPRRADLLPSDEPAVALRLVQLGDETIAWPASGRAVGFRVPAHVRFSRFSISLPEPPADAWPEAPDLVWTGDELIVIGAQGDQLVAAALDPTSNTWRSLPPTLPVATRCDCELGTHAAIWTGHDVLVYVGALANGYVDIAESGGGALLAYDAEFDDWRLVHHSAIDVPIPVGAINGRVMLRNEAGVFISPVDWRPRGRPIPPDGLVINPYPVAAELLDGYGLGVPSPPANVSECSAEDLQARIGRGESLMGTVYTGILVTNATSDECGLPVDLNFYVEGIRRAPLAARDELLNELVPRGSPIANFYADPLIPSGGSIALTFLGTHPGVLGDVPERDLRVPMSLTIRFPDDGEILLDLADLDDPVIWVRDWFGPLEVWDELLQQVEP